MSMHDGREGVSGGRATFSTIQGLLEASMPGGARWTLLLSDGSVWCAGRVDAGGDLQPHPLSVARDGQYFPLSEMSIGSGTGQIEAINDGDGASITSAGLVLDSSGTHLAPAVRLPIEMDRPMLLEAHIQMDSVATTQRFSIVATRSKAATYGSIDAHGVHTYYVSGAWRQYSTKIVAGVQSYGNYSVLSSLADARFAGVIYAGATYPLITGQQNLWGDPDVQAADRWGAVNGTDFTDLTETFFVDLRLYNGGKVTIEGIKLTDSEGQGLS